jgi:hypothetical protein
MFDSNLTQPAKNNDFVLLTVNRNRFLVIVIHCDTFRSWTVVDDKGLWVMGR